MRKIIVLSFIFSIFSGCSLLPIVKFEALLVSFEYDGTVSQAKNVLISDLRRDYLISDKNDKLVFSTNPYQSERKGFLPWGPIWEERIEVSLVLVEKTSTKENKTIVAFSSKVYERQSNKFEWKEKSGEASDEIIEESLARRVEKVVRGGV